MKIISIIIILVLQFVKLNGQIKYDHTNHDINIQDSSFKALLTSYIGKTGKDFVDGMYRKGYVYESLYCLGDKSRLVHWIFTSYGNVTIQLFIGEQIVTEFNKYKTPIKRFKKFNMYKIQWIKVEKSNIEPSKKISDYYYIKQEVK
jgi:hypothetical protein